MSMHMASQSAEVHGHMDHTTLQKLTAASGIRCYAGDLQQLLPVTSYGVLVVSAFCGVVLSNVRYDCE